MEATSNEKPNPAKDDLPSLQEETQCELMPSPLEEQEESSRDLYLDMEPLQSIANGKSIRVPRNPHFTRKDVVLAFQTAFELTGGVPRLAIWANDNYTEFTKLYARLLPSQASSA